MVVTGRRREAGEELATRLGPAVSFLAADASGFVNGQDIAVDGGLTAGRPASVSAEAYRHIGALAREAAGSHIT